MPDHNNNFYFSKCVLVNCVWNPWSDWTSYCKCPRKAKPGRKQRTRTIKTPADFGGKPCLDRNMKPMPEGMTMILIVDIQSNLVIRNILVSAKLFLKAKCSLLPSVHYSSYAHVSRALK